MATLPDNENPEYQPHRSTRGPWITALVVILGVALGLLLAFLFVRTIEAPAESPYEGGAESYPADSPITKITSEVSPSPSTPPPIAGRFAEIKACIITSNEHLPLRMYLANTRQLRSKGLQEVTGLPENTGMLFVYNETRSAESQFWMHNTPMNLDIAYLDGRGTIRTIQQMPACSKEADNCPRYQAGVPFLAAAEFPQGFFRKNGVTVGDRLSTDFFSDCQQ